MGTRSTDRPLCQRSNTEQHSAVGAVGAVGAVCALILCRKENEEQELTLEDRIAGDGSVLGLCALNKQL